VTLVREGRIELRKSNGRISRLINPFQFLFKIWKCPPAEA